MVNYQWSNNLSFQFAIIINEAIKDIDPSIRFISQPGRYYVTASTYAVTNVTGKKRVIEDNRTSYIYYINDGKFRSFLDKILQKDKTILLDDVSCIALMSDGCKW